ncbi:unnamed protein product [Paramecium pentaurelia]|uniref:Uncharacterized protein n=1 Tax=Paramecium pentaurelia TaxID=43138 RepID=A0A8S1VMJ4_9CILI|nr:unnamed protein product [Paramecium pentaurelia]
MQSDFQEEVVKSEYVQAEDQSFKFVNMPSYNPEQLVEDRLRESIRQSAAQRTVNHQDDPTSVKFHRHQSYNQLQAWMEQVGIDMQQHRQIIKDVFRILEKRIAISNRSIQNLIHFIKTFVQHEKQNVEYLRTKNNAINKLFQDGQTLYYPKLDETIKEICNYDQGNAIKILNLLDGIDKFIKEKLDFNIEMFETGISIHRDQYRKAFSNFASSSSKLTKYRRKHQGLYLRQMQGESKGKDLYHTERKLINSFLEMAKLQKNMGQSVTRLFDEVKKQEIHRYQIVITSLRMYLDKHVQLSQSKQQQISAQEELIYGLINQLEAEQVVQSFEVLNFLGQDIVKIIQKMLGKQSLTLPQLQEFLCNYPDTYIKLGSVQENHSLVKLRIKNAQIDCGNVLKTWKPCQIIATIDNNILIYLKENNEFKGKFLCDSSQIVQKTRVPLTAEIKYTKPGFIFDSTKTALLQLEAQDFDALHGLLFKQIK